MQEFLSAVDWEAVSRIAWPLAVAFLSGTLTPTTIRRALWPLACALGRGIRAVSLRTAAALRRKPDPQLTDLVIRMSELAVIQRAQSGYLQSLAAELTGPGARLPVEVCSDRRKG